MALEDLLREAAARGITHLSLSPTPSADGKHTYWRAIATPSTEHKYVVCACEDPVDAVTQVLAAMSKAPRRSPKPTPQNELAVTATVTVEPETPSQAEAPEAKPEAVPEPVPSAPLDLEEEFASWLPKP